MTVSAGAAAFNVQTESESETEALGARLAAALPAGVVVALRGDLATGKTCLVRGMARHFAGQDTLVHSPTFTLVNQYGSSPTLYHLDLYRLGGPVEVAGLGHEELFDMPDGICVVEWAERAEPLLPAERLDVHLEHAGGDARKLAFIKRGLDAFDLARALS